MMLGWFSAEAALASCTKRALALGVGDLLRRQHLDGDEAVQVRVAGLVDHTHPALAELLEDLVVRDGASDHAALQFQIKEYGSRSVGSIVPPRESVGGTRNILPPCHGRYASRPSVSDWRVACRPRLACRKMAAP